MKPIEFLPESVRKQRASRDRLVRTGWLLGLCLLGMAGLTFARQSRIDQARADYGGLAERAAGAKRLAEMVGPLERQMSDLLIKKRIDQEIGGRTDCTAILAELCRLTPANLALVSLRMQAVSVQPTAGGSTRRSARPAVARGSGASGEATRRMQLVLTGMAPSDVDVANFIGQLSASCLFEDVTMGYARTVEHSGRMAREFQASCYLVNQ